MTGTTSVRLPSDFSTSTARPRLTVSCLTRRGLPSAPSTNVFLQHRDGVGDGAHDGVADEVGEGDLAEPAALAVPVDHLAVDLEQLGRDVAEARRRRHGEAAGHVGGDRGADAADRCARLCLLGRLARLPRRDGLRRRAGGLRRPSGLHRSSAGAGAHGRRSRPCALGASPVAPSRGRARPSRRRSASTLGRGRGGGVGLQGGVGRLVVGEELLPCLAHRRRVVPELLVHLLDQPGVGPEVSRQSLRSTVRSGSPTERAEGTRLARSHLGSGTAAAGPCRRSRSGRPRRLTTIGAGPAARRPWGVAIEQPVDRQDPQRRHRRPQRERQDDARRGAAAALRASWRGRGGSRTGRRCATPSPRS